MIVAGIDIGSRTTKAVLMERNDVIGAKITFTGPNSTGSSHETMNLLLNHSGLSYSDVAFIVGTGYGRLRVPFAQRNISEISCHAKGAHWFFPEVRTILDIGGQDCKAIRCDERAKVKQFVMSDKCSAGTGRYLERLARTLEVPLEKIGPLSLQVMNAPVSIGSFCTLFAQADVITYLRRGDHVNDILAGASDAVTKRFMALLQKVGLAEVFVMTGGVAKNIGVVERLERQAGMRIHVPPDPQIIGAIGAACFAWEIMARKEKDDLSHQVHKNELKI